MRLIVATVIFLGTAFPVSAAPITFTPSSDQSAARTAMGPRPDTRIYNLINLDAGGSTTLAMEDPITHVDRVINSVATQRFVGSSIAIFADPVPVPEPATLLLVGVCLCLVRRRWRTRES